MGSCSPVTGGVTCAVGCVQVGFAQWGKWTSLKSTCVDVNRTLLGDLMNRKFDLFPGATPMYTISSDLGAILLACISSGRCMYAVHPKTCRCLAEIHAGPQKGLERVHDERKRTYCQKGK